MQLFVSPVIPYVRCVQGLAHNGQLTAICVGMLHTQPRNVWKVVMPPQVRKLNSVLTCLQDVLKTITDKICLFCLEYFVEDSRFCRPCVENCLGCTGPSFTDCLQCAPGFVQEFSKDRSS